MRPRCENNLWLFKRLSSNAAANEEARHVLGMVSLPTNDARTMLGERRVSARRGWAGEKIDFFSILLNKEFEHGRGDDISETDL